MLSYIAVLIFYSSPVAAAPDGADLLAACEHALQHDFQGVKGKMCQWYVTPCDCDHGQQPRPRVCLPQDIPVDTLAREVIMGIREKHELQSESAGMAAAIILSEHYPCADGE